MPSANPSNPSQSQPQHQMPAPNLDLDILLIGAGFSGIYLLHHLRTLNFRVKIFEAAPTLGGTWFWNSYPGARSDSDYHIYQLSLPQLWQGKDDGGEEWNWGERYAGREEMMRYFEFVERKLDLKRDCFFETRVKGARFDKAANRWRVEAENGATARARYIILCTGFASKPLYPDIPGLESFKGEVHHTARWPQDGVDLDGKRVGVIGTGASGVQVIQELGPKVKQLTVFQRTPNLALPMGQYTLDEKTKKRMKEELYPVYFNFRPQTFGGFHHALPPTPLSVALKESPEQVRLNLEELWAKGGFWVWLASYGDIFADPTSNRVLYDFWKKKVRERLRDAGVPEGVKTKLAPEEPPHAFGIKRPSLERGYWETYARPNVSLVDLKETPIMSAGPGGVRTRDGTEHKLDVVVLATGFDAVSGPISAIQIQGTDRDGNGETVGEKWKRGLRTYLGTMTSGYPNMFFVYGPHGPTQFCNGPTCIEIQSNWIISLLQHLRSQDYTLVEPSAAAEATYSKTVNDIFGAGLWLTTNSSYNGGNVPGKKVESMNFGGGVPMYRQLLKEEEEGGYKGFVFGGKREKAACKL